MRRNLPARLAVPGLVIVLLAGGVGMPTGAAPPPPEDSLVLVPETHGTFVVGLRGIAVGAPPGTAVPAVSAANWTVQADACHDRIYMDLDWTPRDLVADRMSPIGLPYNFIVRVTQDNETHERTVLEPVERFFVGTPPDPSAAFSFSLVARVGVMVDWNLTAWAYPTIGPLPGCPPDA